MSVRPSLRFAASAAVAASISGAVVLMLASRNGSADIFWTSMGWAPVSAAGVLGGAWLAEAHGRLDRRFFAAFAVGIAARSLTVLGCLVFALAGGTQAWKACLVGLAAGYFPVQLVEIGWFLRPGSKAAPSAAAGHNARGLA